MSSQTLRCLTLAVLLVTNGFAQTSPTTEPTSAPVVQPATAPAAVSLEGTFVPRDAFVVELKPKSYAGTYEIDQVVANGSAVKVGDPLITFDVSDLEDQILIATSDLEVAQAALASEEAARTLGERSDAQSLETKTDALSDAQTNLEYWKKQDGPDFLKRLEMGLKSTKDSVDDQNDELDQLRKMYKSESLTNATADIVVRRAVRSLERSQEALKLTENEVEKQKTTAYVDQQQAVERAVASAQLSLDQFNADLAKGRASRINSVLKARLAAKAAQKKLSELEQDKAALDFKSPGEGVAFYGGVKAGAWQGGSSDALKVDEKAETGRPILTVVKPGKLNVIAKADEAKVQKLKLNEPVQVKSETLDEVALSGRVTKIAPIAGADGNYDVEVALDADADVRLRPGMKAKLEIVEEAK